MNWLLFIIVLGRGDPFVGFHGAPIALLGDQAICEGVGQSFANALNTESVLSGAPETFEFRCVYRPPGQPA